MRDILIYFSLKYNGDFNKIYEALNVKEKTNQDLATELFRDYGNTKAITIVDENYPEILKGMNSPPFVLFYEGNLELLRNGTDEVQFNVSDHMTRLVTKINPEISNKGLVLDYLVACESKEDLTLVMNKLESQGFEIKENSKEMENLMNMNQSIH